MDELQTIRGALESIVSALVARKGTPDELKVSIYDTVALKDSLAALSRLEAHAAEMPDTKGLIHLIKTEQIGDGDAGLLIGQYAYRYSEDIRKDRDKWRSLAADYAGAVSKMMGK